MRRIAVLACLGASLLVQAPAAAQSAGSAVTPPPAQAAGEPVTPEKRALVRRYLQAIQYERMMDQLMASMLPVMAESMARQHPGVAAAEQQQVVGIVRDVMRTSMTPKIMERMEPVYAATFTEAELRSIVDFYESPAGRAVTAKAPLLAPQAAAVVRALIPEMQAEVARRVCQQLHCDAAPSAKPRAS